jgi:phosphotransferase system HPr (HPr) family protein
MSGEDGVVVQREVEIRNDQGLHARPVMQFVDKASQFTSSVTVFKGKLSVDGKSPMEMMLLEATKGTRLTLEATGPDAEEALEALAQLIAGGFNENSDS